MRQLVMLLATLGVLASCGSETTYDPLARHSASFDVRTFEDGEAADALLLEIDPTHQTVCADGPELDRLRPHLDENGSGVFEHEGDLVEISVRPIPERITELWDQGKLVGYGCAIQ